jgi:hypothetical protein
MAHVTVFHCIHCGQPMPESWYDVFCPPCLEDVHAGLAVLLAHPWNSVVSWADFFELLPRLLHRPQGRHRQSA